MARVAGVKEDTDNLRNSEVQKRYEANLESGVWSDVLFIVGAEKQEIKAHKVILSAGSKVFEALFKVDMDNNFFEVPDLEPEEFTKLLKYLYTGEYQMNVEHCVPLMTAATKYELTRLENLCRNFVFETLTHESAIKVFQHAIKYEQHELENLALACICKNAFLIVESEQFLKLSFEELIKILERDELEVKNEIQLFEAVINWGRAQYKRQKFLETPEYMRLVLEKLTHLIRFPLMDPSDFSLKVVSTKILSPEEFMEVMLYFNANLEQRALVPPGVFSSKPRTALSHRETKFVLTRLIKNDRALIIDFGTRKCTGNNFLFSSFCEESIWLKSSMPICVTSIGMNSTHSTAAAYCCDAILVLIELKDVDRNILATQRETVRGVKARTDSVYHVKFNNPAHLRANEWYMACSKVPTGRGFFAAPYTALDGVGTNLNFKLSDGSDRTVEFEFKNVAYLKYTGTTQGFIPEIGFTVD